MFTTFNDYGGWNDYGTSTLSGILAVVIPLLGADGAVHMGEELRDASSALPKAMILTTVFNGAMGWIMIITFCMVLGNLDDVIATPTGQPYIAVFYNVTQSYVGASVLSALVIVMAMFCNLSITATASRQLFAFARDQGVPYARWFAYIPPGWDVPMNSIVVSFVVSCLFSIINIGSTIALNNITSLATAILTSYIISIGLVLWRRVTNRPLLPSKFTLSKPVGIALNVYSLAFLCIVFVFAFFPGTPTPTLSQMNWAVLIYGGIMGFAVIYYMVWARKVYDGPVEYVRKL